jgi:hypothetical protein
MGGACSLHGREKNYIESLGGKTEITRSLARNQHAWDSSGPEQRPVVYSSEYVMKSRMS